MLQEKQKWTKPRRSLTPGDIVLVVDATALRGSWTMGKVLDARPVAKGLVRSSSLASWTDRHLFLSLSISLSLLIFLTSFFLFIVGSSGIR